MMRPNHLHAFLLALTLAPGCASTTATISGQQIPRANFGYTDRRFYWINHRNAYPGGRGPSSGVHSSDGSLAGRICGADIYYDSTYRGRRLSMQGFLRPQIESVGEQLAWMEVRDRVMPDGALREFKGGVGVSNGVGTASGSLVRAALTQPGAVFRPNKSGLSLPGLPTLALGALAGGNPVVDFRMGPARFIGQVASRKFDLRRQGDSYVGQLHTLDGKTYEYEIRGVSNIWLMPAADQAAILPLMLSCAQYVDSQLGDPVLRVDFNIR